MISNQISLEFFNSSQVKDFKLSIIYNEAYQPLPAKTNKELFILSLGKILYEYGEISKVILLKY